MSKLVAQPLSYRHIYHAGNHADVLKHSVMACLIGSSLRRHNDGVVYVDTHSGPGGVYDLESDLASQKAEGRKGIARIYDISRLAALNPQVKSKSKLRKFMENTAKKSKISDFIYEKDILDDDTLYLRLFGPSSDLYDNIPRNNGYGVPGAKFAASQETIHKDSEPIQTKITLEPVDALNEEFSKSPRTFYNAKEIRTFKRAHEKSYFHVSHTGLTTLYATGQKHHKNICIEVEDGVVRSIDTLSPDNILVAMSLIHKNTTTTTSPSTATLASFVRYQLPLPPAILPYISLMETANVPKDLSTMMELPDPENLPTTIIDRYNANPHKLDKFMKRAKKREQQGTFFLAGRSTATMKSEFMKALMTQGVNRDLLPADSRVTFDSHYNSHNLQLHVDKITAANVDLITSPFNLSDDPIADPTFLKEDGLFQVSEHTGNMLGRVPIPIDPQSPSNVNISDVNIAAPFHRNTERSRPKASELLRGLKDIPKESLKQMEYGNRKDLQGDQDVMDEYFDVAFEGATEVPAKEHFQRRYDASKSNTRTKSRIANMERRKKYTEQTNQKTGDKTVYFNADKSSFDVRNTQSNKRVNPLRGEDDNQFNDFDDDDQPSKRIHYRSRERQTDSLRSSRTNNQGSKRQYSSVVHERVTQWAKHRVYTYFSNTSSTQRVGGALSHNITARRSTNSLNPALGNVLNTMKSFMSTNNDDDDFIVPTDVWSTIMKKNKTKKKHVHESQLTKPLVDDFMSKKTENELKQKELKKEMTLKERNVKYNDKTNSKSNAMAVSYQPVSKSHNKKKFDPSLSTDDVINYRGGREVEEIDDVFAEFLNDHDAESLESIADAQFPVEFTRISPEGFRYPEESKIDTRSRRREVRGRMQDALDNLQDENVAGMKVWPGAVDSIPLYDSIMHELGKRVHDPNFIDVTTVDYPEPTTHAKMRLSSGMGSIPDNLEITNEMVANTTFVTNSGLSELTLHNEQGFILNTDRALVHAPSSPLLFSTAMRPRKDRAFFHELHSSEYAILLDNHVNPSIGQQFTMQTAENVAKRSYIEQQNVDNPYRSLAKKRMEKDMVGFRSDPTFSERSHEVNKSLGKFIDGFTFTRQNSKQPLLLEEFESQNKIQQENLFNDDTIYADKLTEVFSLGGGVVVSKKNGFNQFAKMLRRYQHLNEQFIELYQRYIRFAKQSSWTNGLPMQAKVTPGMILIDPAYEGSHEYASALNSLRNSLMMWPNACISIWYPVIRSNSLLRSEKRDIVRHLQNKGVENIDENALTVNDFVPSSVQFSVNPEQDDYFLNMLRQEFSKYPRCKHRSLFLDIVKRIVHSEEVRKIQNSELNYNLYKDYEDIKAQKHATSRQSGVSRMSENEDIRDNEIYKKFKYSSYHKVASGAYTAVAEVYSAVEDRTEQSSLTVGSGMLVVNPPEPEHFKWQLEGLVPWLSSVLCDDAPTMVSKMNKQMVHNEDVNSEPIGEYALEWL